MPESGLDERVARLEGRVEGFDDRFDGLERRIDRVEARIDALDANVNRFRAELASRIESLDQKVSRQFTWLVGIQVAVLLAVVAALAGR
jgi:tetrahydromethanopterin S-methyltransferase subunit G